MKQTVQQSGLGTGGLTMSKKSHERYVEDHEAAQDAAYRTKGAEYTDELNPHPESDEIRFERFRRLYGKARKRYFDVSARWNDLCEVYGFPTPEEMEALQ